MLAMFLAVTATQIAIPILVVLIITLLIFAFSV